MSTHPIDFHPPTEEAPAFLLPKAGTLFAERADRFAVLARDHALSEWLDFLGKISAAQQYAQARLPALPLPDADTLARAQTHGMPPLDPAKRPALWREALRDIANALLPEAPEGASKALNALLAADDARLERLADALLVNGDIQEGDAAELPFIGAALQVVFTQLASQLAVSALQPMDAHNVCPCCGSPAVASVVRLGAAINNLRYLHCSLCNTEWNVARAVCTSCGNDKTVALHQLEGSDGRVRAETCDECHSTLKIVYQDKDPNVDPVADDLATLALDMLIDEAGYQRAGPNLLLIGAHSG